MKYLIKFKCNYADEFDTSGFITESSLEDFNKSMTFVQKYFELYPGVELEVYFGTNEQLTFEDFESYRECFTITEISDEEHETLLKLFTPSVSYLTECDWGITAGFEADLQIADDYDDFPQELQDMCDEFWPKYNCE